MMRPNVLACLLAVGCATTPAHHPEAPAAASVAPADREDAALKQELLSMKEEDQRVRRAWIANPQDATIKSEVEKVDRRNERRVVEIIDQRGWPGKTLVGEKASAAAWTILQHSTLELLHRYLPVMEAAAEAGELDWSLVATTVDRVRINESRPQVYGTQFRQENGKWVPYPIEDEARVDERRKRVGLQPLSEYAEALRKAYEAQPRKQ